MHLVQGFSKVLIPLQKNCCSWSSIQPFAVQIMFSSSETLSFHEFFQFRKKQKSLGARTTYLITGQLQHWLPSIMPALNYSVTHCIHHSYSYCMANDWLEDQEQQFFYNGIRASEKCWTRCILVTGEYVKKVTKYDLHISYLTVSVYELFECPSYIGVYNVALYNN